MAGQNVSVMDRNLALEAVRVTEAAALAPTAMHSAAAHPAAPRPTAERATNISVASGGCPATCVVHGCGSVASTWPV